MRKSRIACALLALTLSGCGAQQLPQVQITLPSVPPSPAPAISGTVPLPSPEQAVLLSLLGAAGYAQAGGGEWVPVGNPELPTYQVDNGRITEARLKQLRCTFTSPSQMLTPQQAQIILAYAKSNNLTSGEERPFTWGENKGSAVTFRCMPA